MQKTILCTIDFSINSNRALNCAASMAHDFKAHLTVLYTYRLIPDTTAEIFERKRKKEAEATQNFAVVENDFLKDKGITYDFRTEVGFVADRVEAFTRTGEVSFVVIDKDMCSKSKETFEELIQTVPVPMVIVP